jgi:hypothetical protein
MKRETIAAESASATVPPDAAPVTKEAEILRSGRRRSSFGHPKHPRPERCLNCGKEPLDTRFCPDCGQENLSHKVPLPELLSDVGEEFLKWDGRLFRTLTLVLFRPGRLAKEYNAGRRVRFVSPFKMYFVVSALFVFLFSLLNPVPNILGIPGTKVRSNRKAAARKSTKDPVKGAAPTDVMWSAQSGVPTTHTEAAKPAGKQANATATSGQGDVASATASKVDQDEDDGGEFNFRLPDGKPIIPKDYLVDGRTRVTQGLYLRAYDQWQQDPKNDHKQRDPLRQAFFRGVFKTIDAPGNYANNLIQGIGRTMVFLLPIYALLLSWLFRGARQFYVEHLVLAVSNHTFAFLLASIVGLVAKERWVPLAILLGLSYWLYEFMALRVVYGQRKRLTLFKQFILWQVYGFAILLGFIATVLVTLMLP